MSEKPKKPQQQKSKRLNLNKKKQWESILKSIDKKEIPITCLRSLTVCLKDGTKVSVDIAELIAEGIPPDEVEFMVNARLQALDSIIDDVDFYISVESVAKTVQPFTDNILKDL